MSYDMLSMDNVVLWAGIALVSIVLLQAIISLILSAKRGQLALTQQQLSVDSLREQVSQKMLFTSLDSNKVTDGWSGLRKFKIDQKTQEGGGVCSFYLVPHDGKSLPPFEPGQYLTFNLKLPDTDKALVRCYSLSDSPHQSGHYRVSIKHALPPPKAPDAPSGLSSTFFHINLNEGDIVDARAPGGNFYLDQTQHSPVVLIGGGVGITPVLSMLNAIVDLDAKREVWFFYGVRNGDEHIMREHLQAIHDAHENIHIQVCYSDPRDGEDHETQDYAHAGRVSVDLFKKVLPSNNYDFYICGPPPMMNSLTSDLEAWGVPTSAIHFEAFGPASVKKKSPPKEDASNNADTSFSVKFSKSNKTLQWDPSKGSLLDLAEENDISMDSGCRAGSCGTCTTAVLSGEVDYLDEPSAPIESGSCLACIGIPKSELVIDA